MTWSSVQLADARRFTWHSGLWKGKRPPLQQAIVVRNTNFVSDGRLDLSDVAVLDVSTKELASRTLLPGDIILERSGGGPKQPVGRVAYFDHNAVLPYSNSNFTSVLRILPEAGLIPRFVHYYLLHLYRSGFTENLQRATTGLRNLDFARYRQAYVPVPPRKEQEAIVGLLQEAQQAAWNKERLVAAIRELKQSTMHRIFTRGLRAEEQKETDIGPLPHSWDVVRLGDFMDLFAGGTPARSVPAYWEGGTIPWVKTAEVDYSLILGTEERVTPEGLRNSAAKLLPSGTVLLAMYGQGVTRGKVAVLGIDATTNQACVGLVPRDPSLKSLFMYYYLEFSYARLRSLSHGAQQQNLNKEIVASLRVPRPGTGEQEDIIRVLQAIDADLSIHKAKEKTLEELFDVLLEDLMAGRLRTSIAQAGRAE